MARIGRAALAILLFSLGLTPIVAAQTGGLPVVVGPGPRDLCLSDPNGSGGVSIVYREDHRLFRTTLDADGSIHATWPSGILFGSGSGPGFAPLVRAGRNDDLFLTWSDDSVRVQRISIGSGAIAPGWPFAGLTVCGSTPGQIHFFGPLLGIDGTNAARLYFQGDLDAGNILFHAAVGANATVVQSCSGVPCGNDANFSTVVEAGGEVVASYTASAYVNATPATAAIASWQPAGTYHRPTENTLGGSCNNVAASTSGGLLVPSSGSDVIMAFYTSPAGFRAQRFSAGTFSFVGGEQWTPGGISLGNLYGGLSSGGSDGAGGAFFVATDYDVGFYTRMIQAVRSDGAIAAGWPADGVFLDQTPGAPTTSPPIDDGAGGAIVGWIRFGGGGASVHAQHVLANGTLDPAWTPGGLELASAPGDKRVLQVARDGAGGAFFVWVDWRNGRPDVYAQHVSHGGQIGPVVGVPAGEAPAAIALSRGIPNPTRGAVAFSLTLPEDAHVQARVLDVAGRIVARVANAPMPAGTHALTWNGNGEDGIAAPAGIYLFEVRGGGSIVHRRVVRL